MDRVPHVSLGPLHLQHGLISAGLSYLNNRELSPPKNNTDGKRFVPKITLTNTPVKITPIKDIFIASKDLFLSQTEAESLN